MRFIYDQLYSRIEYIFKNRMEELTVDQDFNGKSLKFIKSSIQRHCRATNFSIIMTGTADNFDT